ncbi:cytochrome p450 protein [Rutstroemia sp. NJR-2017a WRK4]|nr:cytochrome p450 protein [Rutstroemia sp. NJR-2017a WRK4]PQE32324.1 cytochrome p450 protein [Rutstroemia sp. NJR-2017a WRK4]
MISLAYSVTIFVFSYVLWAVYIAIWRLYFSPIAKFPGPKLAALTQWYEVYYDLFKGGQLIFKLLELHEKYGPIVRINPWELHINDPDYFEELYCAKRDKHSYYTNGFGLPESVVATIPHELHKIRRVPFNKFFSKAMINKYSPVIQSKLDLLIARLRTMKAENKVVSMNLAYTCYAADVVNQFAFGRSYNYIENADDFHTPIHDAIDDMTACVHFFRMAPWIIKPIQSLPGWVIKMLGAKTIAFYNWGKDTEKLVHEVMTNQNQNEKEPEHKTIFHAILESDTLPASEKTLDRLRQEGQTVVGAGTDTTVGVLSMATFHILANPDIRMKLLAELTPVFEKTNGRPSLADLELLPYLKAVASEALRLSVGLSSHLQRVDHHNEMRYQDWIIPKSVPTSQSVMHVTYSPRIFPSPHSFAPDRWLVPNPPTKYLVSFSRGPRACPGINLAYAELYLALAYLFYTFQDMELYDTEENDVRIKADLFVPRSSGRGVRVSL